jgi:outer membrane protein W
MKKLLLSVLAVLVFGFSYAQKMDGFRVGIDLGYVKPASGGGGISFTIEPKYNISDNMNVGLKIGGAGMVKEVVYSNGQTTKAQIGAVAFYTGTFDYYFHESGKDFAPFVGGGISYNALANVEIKTDNGTTPPITNIEAKTKMGGLLRAGFEYQHFRLGLEYNIIPRSTLQNASGAAIGTISNSYFGLNLGFYIGGGKWAN